MHFPTSSILRFLLCALPMIAGSIGEAQSAASAAEETPMPPAEPMQFEGLAMNSQDFPIEDTHFYRHRNRWLAINPNHHESATTSAPFPFANGIYDVTLHMVGENDGRCRYEVSVAEQSLGTVECPLADAMFAEGEAFTHTWKGIALAHGTDIAVRAHIASEDGQEYARARWIGLTFKPVTTQPPPVTDASPLIQPREADGNGEVTIEGELKQWHAVTLTADGPFAHERDVSPNPFTDYRFTVTFTHESGEPSYSVPGYFAADGQAGRSSAESGTVWKAHLSPDKAGRWDYQIDFQKGHHIAIDEGEASPVASLDGQTGSFTVSASDKSGRDFRAHGRLSYVGERYLRFAGTNEIFLKAGADAPETLLGYADFDGTYPARAKIPIKTWSPHVRDWKIGDPEWGNARGHGLIGALNYLASEGLNGFSFLTYNAGGDGDNVWPFVERNAPLHYDCSKLDQWNLVFSHAQQLGLHLQFKLQETENDDQRWSSGRQEKAIPTALDGGATGISRKLYLRELVARFGHHLALTWNLGEENTQTPEEQKAMGEYLRSVDPYDHLLVIHSYPDQQDEVYPPLLGSDSPLTGASLQNEWDHTHERTLQWIEASREAGKQWVVANDEQGPARTGVPPDPGYDGFGGRAIYREYDYTLHDIRKQTLWGNLMAGGAGVEYYFGYWLPQNDLECEDFRSRDQSWDYCRIALEFFRDHAIPVDSMQSVDDLVTSTNSELVYGFAEPERLYLLYLPEGGYAKLDLSAVSGRFSVHWFNPREGGDLIEASVTSIRGGQVAKLGLPPRDLLEDWLIVVRRLD